MEQIDIVNQRFKDVVNFLIEKGIAHNQAVICSKSGINKSTFSELMNGKQRISERYVRKIHKAFPIISVEYILTGDGNMVEPEKKAVTEPAPSKEDVKMPREVFSLLATQVETLKSQQETIRSQQELINRLVKTDISQ